MLAATVIAGAVLVVGTIGPPLFGQGVFLGSDTVANVYPWRAFIDPVAENVGHHGPIGDTIDSGFPARATFFDDLRDGTFRGWNPLVVGGKPQGTQSANGELNPFAFSAYLVSPNWYAPALVKLTTMAAGIAFTYLFCRRLRVGRVPALFGGFAFAGSGFAVMWTNWSQVEVAALIPGLFWATERFLQRPRIVTVIPISLAMAAMLLGNFPAIVFYALYALGPYVLVRSLAMRDRSVGRVVSRLAGSGVGVVAGALLVAVTLLPFALGLDDTGTGERNQSPDNNLEVSTLVTTVAPKALGLSTEGPSGAYFGPHNQVEVIAFVGVTTALLAVVAVALPPSRSTPRGVREVLLGITIVVGWAAFVGGDVLAFLQNFPAFDNSFIGRTRSILGFTVAVLAALGLQAIVDRRWPATWRQRLWSLVVGATTATIAVVAATRALDLARAAERVEVLRSAVVLAGVIGVLAAIAVGLVRFGGRRVAALGLAVIPALLVAESLNFSLPLLPNEDRSTLYPTTPGIDFLTDTVGEERIAAEGATLLGSASEMYGLRSAVGHAFASKAWKEALQAVDPAAYRLSPTFPHLAPTAEVMGSPLLDRMGVNWFVASPQSPPPGDREAVTAMEASCERTVPLSDEAVVAVAAQRGVRGVVVRVCEPVQVPHGAAITAEIEGAAAGQAFLPRELGPGELSMAVPAEELQASAPASLRLSLDGTGGRPLVLAAGPDGEPAVDVVRPVDDGLRLAYADDLRVYERTRALDRIWWAGQAEVVLDDDERLARLASGDVPGGTIVLSDDSPAGDGAPARIDVTRDDGSSIAVTVEAEGAGYVVVSDSLRGQWAATLDGERAELVAADHAGVAVHVPEGRHDVELHLRPPGQRAGIALSAVTAFALAGGVVWDWRRRSSRVRADGPVDPTEPVPDRH